MDIVASGFGPAAGPRGPVMEPAVHASTEPASAKFDQEPAMVGEDERKLDIDVVPSPGGVATT